MHRSISAVLALSLVLGGCASGRINSRWPWPVEPAAPGSAGLPLRQMQVNVTLLLEQSLAYNTATYPDKITDQEKLTILLAAVDRDIRRRKDVRNTVVSQLVAASTANCSIYVQALRSGQVTSRLSTDLLATGFGLAGSLTSPIDNARILSSLSAMSTATGASIDRNIFAEQGAELVADSIMQLRESGRLNLERRLKSPYEEWPIGLALADVFAFHSDCTMLRGFSKMREAVVLRDQAVKAARINAMEVASRGGSGADVAAAVAGVEKAFLSSGGINDPAMPITVSTGVPTGDLEQMRAAALDCLDMAQRAMTASEDMRLASVLAAAPFDADGACAKAEGQWARKFVATAVDTLSKAKDGKPDQIQIEAAAAKSPPASSVLTAAEGRVRDGEKALKEARQAGDEAVIASAASELEAGKTALAELNGKIRRHETDYVGRGARLGQAFQELQRDLETAIDMEIRAIGTNRAIALQYALTLGEGGREATDVEAALKRIGGDPTEDPLFKAMYAAVAEIKSSNGSNGLMAARSAQAVAQTYSATFQLPK